MPQGLRAWLLQHLLQTPKKTVPLMQPTDLQYLAWLNRECAGAVPSRTVVTHVVQSLLC